MGKPSAPAAPNYQQAAQQQGAANVKSAIAQSILNRPNEVTPYGTRTWEQTGGFWTPGENQEEIPIFTAKTELTPLGQQRFDQEQRIIDRVGDLAESGVSRVQGAMSKPFDFASAADARQQSQDALSGRLEPRLAQDREALRTQLINQGFRIGTEGYDKAMKRADEQATDARLQVINQAGQEQDRMVQLASMLRQQPLNELNALRTGSQINLPQFQAYSNSANVAAAPIFGASQAQGQWDANAFNQKMGSYNNMMSGLFDIGAAYFGKPG